MRGLAIAGVFALAACGDEPQARLQPAMHFVPPEPDPGPRVARATAADAEDVRQFDELFVGARSGVLYAVEPRRVERGDVNTRPLIDQWPIISERPLTEAELTRVHAALLELVRDDGAASAACFDPHHAVRLSSDRGDVDVVICFECNSLTFRSERASGSLSMGFARAPRDLFAKLLAR